MTSVFTTFIGQNLLKSAARMNDGSSPFSGKAGASDLSIYERVYMRLGHIIVSAVVFSCILSCCAGGDSGNGESSGLYFSNPVKPEGGDPWAIFHQGKYYYTESGEDVICLWETEDITDFRSARMDTVWVPVHSYNAFHHWAPEIHNFDGKWYIYYSADDGNSDNRRTYVLENTSEDPFDGKFVFKGQVRTDTGNSLAIHSSTFEHKGKRYLIWSGWQTKRIYEEVQCIYIAEMENPWTLASERVLISRPEYEWECQWIGLDGNSGAYPVYVNEAPHFIKSPDGKRLFIFYTASANWTPYSCIGLLCADSGSDLLDPMSWKKSAEPVFSPSPENHVFAIGNLCVIPSPDSTECYILYHARKSLNDMLVSDSRSPRIQKMEWDGNGFPVPGIPIKEGIRLRKPAK